MKNFSEKERCCELAFQSIRPYWHTYTSGRQTPILFANNQDMALVMNIIAQAAFEYAGEVKIIAYAVMNNHLHFVLAGSLPPINMMLSFVMKRIRRAFRLEKLPEVSSKLIEDLASMRNHIVYVHRNGYVTNPEFTPFSYPWGSGAYYFMPSGHGRPFSKITSIENRLMFRSRDIRLPADWEVTDADSTTGFSLDVTKGNKPNNIQYITPPSFCDIRLGIAMFRDAHHYFAAVSKNVEAYSGIAVELDDGEFLTDQELFTRLLQIIREKYRMASTRELTGAQRLDLARILHYDYRSSNGQIRRLLGLDEYEINSLFPLSHK